MAGLWCFLIGFIILVLLIIALVALMYNRLIMLRNRIDNAWAQIDVQLKRRYDLIPNLVQTVKGYAAHEKELFENVTKARAEAIKAGDVKEQTKAENMLTQTLRSLFAVAENYPELKANENFMMLQEELAGTEGKIAFARQFYNDTVMKLNTMIQSFPVNMLAPAFGFDMRDYFEIEDQSRQPVKVDFGKSESEEKKK